MVQGNKNLERKLHVVHEETNKTRPKTIMKHCSKLDSDLTQLDMQKWEETVVQTFSLDTKHCANFDQQTSQWIIVDLFNLFNSRTKNQLEPNWDQISRGCVGFLESLMTQLYHSTIFIEHSQDSYHTFDLFTFVPYGTKKATFPVSKVEQLDLKGKVKYEFHMNWGVMELQRNFMPLSEVEKRMGMSTCTILYYRDVKGDLFSHFLSLLKQDMTQTELLYHSRYEQSYSAWRYIEMRVGQFYPLEHFNGGIDRIASPFMSLSPSCDVAQEITIEGPPNSFEREPTTPLQCVMM